MAKPVHLETLSGKEWEGFQPTAYILTTKVFDLPLLVSSNGQETPTTVGAVLRELWPWLNSEEARDPEPLENLIIERGVLGRVTIRSSDGKEKDILGPPFSKDVFTALLELAKEGINGFGCWWCWYDSDSSSLDDKHVFSFFVADGKRIVSDEVFLSSFSG